MPFDKETAEKVRKYAGAHIADDTWHLSFFNFINHDVLAKRLGEEFLSTRFLYKILEGLEADAWLKRAQIRLQILSYASIYEAVLHHILFTELVEEDSVKALTRVQMKKEISIPTESLAILEKHLRHNGKNIIPTYEGLGRRKKTAIGFDEKAHCAFQFRIIDEKMRDELTAFYEYRNSIHIHAEIRKGINYELKLSMDSYRRLQPFKEQIMSWQGTRVPTPPA